MVEINNQQQGVPRYAGVVRGTGNGRQKSDHGYDVIVGGELFTDYSVTPRKLVTLNPKASKSTGTWTHSFFPVGGMPTHDDSLKDFSPKSQDAVATRQIKGAWRFAYD